jgi:hypothetical protein
MKARVGSPVPETGHARPEALTGLTATVAAPGPAACGLRKIRSAWGPTIAAFGETGLPALPNPC